MEIKDANVLVTGGSQGFGAVLCREFAVRGAHVFLNCAHNAEKARKIAEKIGAEVKIFDISDAEAVKQAFAEIFSACGGLDILVNNARMDPYKRPESMSDSSWFDLMTGVNLKGPYLCSLEAMKQMKERGKGRIVNISSVWGYRAAPEKMLEYAMTKAALHSLTRSMAGLGAPFGITVNAVAPGYILSEEARERLSPEEFISISKRIPLGRGAAPEEIAGAVFYAVENSYVTGEILNINGGTYMP